MQEYSRQFTSEYLAELWQEPDLTESTVADLGRKINFFLYFKVVANSKKLVVIMTHTQTILTLSLCQID